jgi:TfoX/Sxy family transcriptional regulator of competence genes
VPYDEELAHRTRELLASEEGVSEMRMFGGLAFLVHGNMSVAVSTHGGLLVRVAPERTEEMLAKSHASLAEMGKRQMRGWLRVAPEGVRSKRDLAAWIKRGVEHARALPPKRGR